MALVGKGTVEVLDPILNPPSLQPSNPARRLSRGRWPAPVSAPDRLVGDYSIRFRLLLTPDMSFQGDIASWLTRSNRTSSTRSRDKGLLDGKEFLAFYEDVFEEPQEP